MGALNYLELPAEVREYAEIVAELSLYKNCTELLCNDSRLVFIVYAENTSLDSAYVLMAQYHNG